MNVMGFAALSVTGPLERFAFGRAPRPDDVVIDILYCGVCHTDLHLARNHGGFTTYPIVPGHEIIGCVSEIGKTVTRFKRGDLVGVGCMVDSCQPCLKGWEQDCIEGSTFTYNSTDRRMAVSPMVAIQMSLSCVISSCCRCLMVSIQPEPRRCFARASRHGRRCVAGMSAKTARLRWSVLAVSDTWP